MHHDPAVDRYIEGFPPAVQALLNQVRDAIRQTAPNATERMAYGIPTYHDGENLIHFGGARKHIGLYPGAEAIIHFADRLQSYHTSKGTIQFPLDKPIPLALIRDITQYRVATAQTKQRK